MRIELGGLEVAGPLAPLTPRDFLSVSVTGQLIAVQIALGPRSTNGWSCSVIIATNAPRMQAVAYSGFNRGVYRKRLDMVLNRDASSRVDLGPSLCPRSSSYGTPMCESENIIPPFKPA